MITKDNMVQRVILSNLLDNDSIESHKDERSPYLLVAVKDDGNVAILEAHSEVINWFLDDLNDDEFVEAYCDDVPTEIGVYEWRGKIDGSKSFEGESDYWLTGEWTAVWKRDA